MLLAPSFSTNHTLVQNLVQKGDDLCFERQAAASRLASKAPSKQTNYVPGTHELYNKEACTSEHASCSLEADLFCLTINLQELYACGQADWERTRKDLDKARHDVERFRRALDKAAVEKRDLQQKVAATQQALQVTGSSQGRGEVIFTECVKYVVWHCVAPQ